MQTLGRRLFLQLAQNVVGLVRRFLLGVIIHNHIACRQLPVKTRQTRMLFVGVNVALRFAKQLLMRHDLGDYARRGRGVAFAAADRVIFDAIAFRKFLLLSRHFVKEKVLDGLSQQDSHGVGGDDVSGPTRSIPRISNGLLPIR
jgi:hypothetical protein